MKKRVFSLLLCLVMVLSVVLTGCGKKVIEPPEQSGDNYTLSMWIISEDKVEKKVADAVTAELNELIESSLKTRLSITYLTKAEYETKLAEAITNFKSPTTEETDGAATTETTATTDTTSSEGSGFQPKFPEVLENQVDIIYIEGEEMYTRFKENGWIRELDSIIASRSENKPLKEYVSAAYLSAIKLDGKTTYAIPNNNTIGDYTYMLMNKELMGEYFYDELAINGKIDGFFTEYVYNYLEAVYTYTNENGAKDDVVLIDGEYNDLLDLLAFYWNVDADAMDLVKAFSVFGHAYDSIDTLSRGSVELGYGNLFANEAFAEGFLKLSDYSNKGFFGDATDKKAAIKFVTCDLIDLENYTDDYYPVIVKYPTLTETDLYDNGMFAVCSKSVNAIRSMEIITYLNTNAAFRNILYYGVEGEHFETQIRTLNGVSYKVAFKLNNPSNLYPVSLDKTGNVVLVYPTVNPEDESESMVLDVWEYLKQQNFEAKIDPMLGFELKSYQDSVDATLLAYMESLNDDLVTILSAVQAEKDLAKLAKLIDEIAILLDAESTATAEDFDLLKSYIEDTESTVANDLAALRVNLQKAMSRNAADASAYSAYVSWLKSTGYKVS